MNELPVSMEIPQGFGAAMAQIPGAMERFAALPAEDREALLQRARSVRSKEEMQSCAASLVE